MSGGRLATFGTEEVAVENDTEEELEGISGEQGRDPALSKAPRVGVNDREELDERVVANDVTREASMQLSEATSTALRPATTAAGLPPP